MRTELAVAADEVRVDEPVDEARLLAHDYDGIREYDNPLPAWWRMIFVGSIVFAGFYVLYFEAIGWGRTPDQAYREQLAEYRDKRGLREAVEAANVNEAVLARNAHDPKILEHGAAVFAVKCVTCHTADGHGLIGPNLTDSFQLHGSTRLDIYHTVHDGAPGTAMIAWGEQLAATDVLDVAAFVTTLRGENLPGKEPQGMPVEAFAP